MEPPQQFFFGKTVKILGMTQAVTAGLQAADSLLEGLLIGLTDAHDLAHRTHLGAQLILNALELLKSPAGKLDDHIVTVGNILVQSAVLAAGDVLQGQSRCQHCGNQSDGETGSLGCQSGGAGGTGIDLNDNIPVGLGVVGPLDIGSADDLDRFHDLIGFLLQALLDILGNGQHRCGAERVAGMDTQGVDILNEADGDHIAVLIPNHFQFQLFPAQDGLLHQHLANQAGLEASGADGAQLIHIINQTAAGTTHGVGRTQNDGVTQLVRNLKRLLHGVGHFASGHFNAQAVHGVLKGNSVLATLNGIHLDTDHLHIVLLQHACLGELGAQVQTGLTTQVGQQHIGPLLGNDLFQPLHIQRFNVGSVRHLRVGHNGSRVGVHQHDLVPQAPQSLTCLGAGVVKLTGLTDNNGAGTNDQRFFLCHNNRLD